MKGNTKKKYHIKDPPFSKQIQLGELATTGGIGFHYQYEDNFMDFLENIKYTHICDFNLLLRVIVNNSISIKYEGSTSKLFMNNIHTCMKEKKLIPIYVGIRVTKDKYIHANLAIINPHLQQIELFDPHGYSPRVGKKVAFKIQSFFKKKLPTYEFIITGDILKHDTFQSKYSEEQDGMCMPWCLLYLHYRILNQKISSRKLVTYLDKTITKRKMLQHSRYIEDLLKHKI